MRVNLREERLRKRMSARVAAELIGVSEDVLLWAERTGRRPTIENAGKIADFYEFDLLEQWPLEEVA